MRFVVYGAGAIGGTIGGRLHQHGHDVVLIARGRHAEVIRTDGITIESPDDTVVLDVPVVTDPADVSFTDRDVVLLATKSHDTEVVVRTLARHTPSTTPIVCAQNGVANERLALRRFAPVHAMVVMCPAAHLSPGLVQVFSAPVTGLLDVGRYPEGTDDTTEAIAAALSSAGFDSRPLADVMRWKYGKLMLNLLNAVEAVTGFGDEVRDLVEAVRAEGRACCAAAGIEVATDEEDRQRRGELIAMRPIAGDRRGGGSSWQSLERRAGEIETDYLNGEIVLLGRLHGVPTPANEALQQAANEMARTGAAPRSMPAAELVARYERLASASPP
jgi:2-dehydropantoate 2-reductase